jgi:hypothetical protein
VFSKVKLYDNQVGDWIARFAGKYEIEKANAMLVEFWEPI